MVVIAFSCKHEDKELPTLSMETPIDSAHYNKGETFRIKGSFQDNNSLHQVHIHMENASGTELLHIEKEISQASFDFDTSYTINNTKQTLLFIELEAHDDAGNEVSKTITIKQN